MALSGASRQKQIPSNYCRIALDFFRAKKIPFHEMSNANARIRNPKNDNSRYCFAKPGVLYLVYLPTVGACELDLTAVQGEFSLQWFSTRAKAARSYRMALPRLAEATREN